MESTSLHPQSVKHASTLRQLSAPVSMPQSDVAKNPHRNVTTHKRGHCSLQVTALTFCPGHTNGARAGIIQNTGAVAFTAVRAHRTSFIHKRRGMGRTRFTSRPPNRLAPLSKRRRLPSPTKNRYKTSKIRHRWEAQLTPPTPPPIIKPPIKICNHHPPQQ
ncbi:hypothetical protein HPB48_009223 [Haemaphysalis longicornis]|uniref:Uncharacterized protein n=1 Tax=Haemaphysalis longicornis TaxID=44386 RepID=A0A9J6FXH7_HAELO|nr:hypothetical protein HPB48_009223 [Haemaphysalis longicornis]